MFLQEGAMILETYYPITLHFSDCTLVVAMVTLQEAYILRSCLFINLFLKLCFVWKKYTLMCPYSYKLEEMALNLLENHIFNILKPPPTSQKADNIRSFPNII